MHYGVSLPRKNYKTLYDGQLLVAVTASTVSLSSAWFRSKLGLISVGIFSRHRRQNILGRHSLNERPPCSADCATSRRSISYASIPLPSQAPNMLPHAPTWPCSDQPRPTYASDKMYTEHLSFLESSVVTGRFKVSAACRGRRPCLQGGARCRPGVRCRRTTRARCGCRVRAAARTPRTCVKNAWTAVDEPTVHWAAKAIRRKHNAPTKSSEESASDAQCQTKGGFARTTSHVGLELRMTSVSRVHGS